MVKKNREYGTAVMASAASFLAAAATLTFIWLVLSYPAEVFVFMFGTAGIALMVATWVVIWMGVYDHLS